jgi:chitodextrinase
MKRRSKFLAIMAGAATMIAVMATVASATPAGTVDYSNVNDLAGINLLAQGRDIQTVTTGTPIKFGAKLVAAVPKTVNQIVFACRTSAGANCDFGWVNNPTIGTSVYTYEQSKTFTAADTYTLWVAYLDGTTWRGFPQHMSVVVGAGAADTTPPSTPTGLTVTGTTSSSASLSWTASTDNVGVTGYDVRRNSTTIQAATGTTFTDSGLSASTTYTYDVRAKDAAGNLSGWSTAVNATTQASGGTSACIPNPGSCGFPTAATTGAHGTLTTVSGDVTLGTAGQTYADKEVNGCITVSAANVTISDVKVHCSGSFGIEYFGPTTGTLTIQDTTIDCGTNISGTAIDDSTPTTSSAHLSILRVDTGQGCENGASIYHDTVVQDSYCHGETPEAGPGGNPNAHTDCIQGDMVHDITIRHNTLLAPFYATSDIEGDCGACGTTVRVRWTVDNNLMSGAGYQLYCASRSPETGSVVTNNRFGRDGWNQPAYATGCTEADTTWTGNVEDSDGASLPKA